MKIKYFLLAAAILAFLGAGSVSAQTLLKGSVHENGSNNKLSNVFIHDNNNKQLGLTDKDGNFQIRTEVGHLLIFDSPGYVSDTLYVTDMSQKKIMLETKTIALREVNINSTRASNFDPHKEYPDVYTKSKLYVLSPTTWFGKDARDARRLKQYFKTEAEDRKVDQVFTRAYVSSIVPLKGQQLDDFMTMYRPSYSFVTSNSSESMVTYINDSYKKYQALPPEKRSLQKLVTQ